METSLNMRMADRSPYFTKPKKVRNPSVRFIAFPYAGASAVAYYQWASHLPPDIELIAIQYPGRGRLSNLELCTSIAALAEEACATVLTLSDVPFVFFGHSLGALVAFESVRILRRLDQTLPQLLIVSASHAPGRRSSFSRNLHTLPDEEFLDGLGSYGGMPDEILQSTDMLAYLLPMLRADMTALNTWTYQPEVALDLPIVAIGGKDDRSVDSVQLQFWREFTASEFRCLMLTGDHFYYKNELPIVVKTISCLIKDMVEC